MAPPKVSDHLDSPATMTAHCPVPSEVMALSKARMTIPWALMRPLAPQPPRHLGLGQVALKALVCRRLTMLAKSGPVVVPAQLTEGLSFNRCMSASC